MRQFAQMSSDFLEAAKGRFPGEFLLERLAVALNAGTGQTAVSAAVLGLVLHLSILKPLEVEQFMYTLIASCFTLILGLLIFHIFSGFPILDAFLRVALISSCLGFGVLFSMVVYRLFFHRLRNFPGPIGAKISKFYSVFLAAKTVQYHKDVARMHEKYGDFIRTGMYLHYYDYMTES